VVVGGNDVSQLATLLVIVGRPFCIRIRELPPIASMTASKFEKASKTHKVWFNKSPKNAQSLVFGFSGLPAGPTLHPRFARRPHLHHHKRLRSEDFERLFLSDSF
jgi:hypothetical protein